MEQTHHTHHVEAHSHAHEGARYAGFWARLAARMIDTAILAVALGIVNAILLPGQHTGNAPAAALDLIVGFGYFCYMTKNGGATAGKKAIGIKVVSQDGSELTWKTVILREVLGKIASSIILDIGFIMAAFTKKKEALHDKIADTYVVYKTHDHDSKSLVIILNTVVLAFVVLAMAVGVMAVVERHSAQQQGFVSPAVPMNPTNGPMIPAGAPAQAYPVSQ